MNFIILANQLPLQQGKGNEQVQLIQSILHKCSIAKQKIFLVLSEKSLASIEADTKTRHLLESVTPIVIKGITKGDGCAALCAMGSINNHEELLIIDSSQNPAVNYPEIITSFQHRNLGAGAAVRSVMDEASGPYVQVDKQGWVIEISKHYHEGDCVAAGLYWFAKGKNFVAAVQNVIRKDAHINSNFYISVSLNELILQGEKVGVWKV